MDGMQLAITIISSGAATAILTGIITLINNKLEFKRKRQAELEDREIVGTKEDFENLKESLKNIENKIDTNNDNINNEVSEIKRGLKFVLYEQIRDLGQQYLAQEEVDFDDRKILNDMHHSYHFGLNGNGDLDLLMDAVNKLPLKQYKDGK